MLPLNLCHCYRSRIKKMTFCQHFTTCPLLTGNFYYYLTLFVIKSISYYIKKIKIVKGKKTRGAKKKKVANDHVTDMYDLRLQKNKK